MRLCLFEYRLNESFSELVDLDELSDALRARVEASLPEGRLALEWDELADARLAAKGGAVEPGLASEACGVVEIHPPD